MCYKFLKDMTGLCGVLVCLILAGCAGGNVSNEGQLESYPMFSPEAEWIRNGDPLDYDEKLWYPQDQTEGLLDTEVYLMGQYRGVQFFVEKKDVKPYNRLYTKFGRNRFRYFELKKYE